MGILIIVQVAADPNRVIALKKGSIATTLLSELVKDPVHLKWHEVKKVDHTG